MKCITLLSAVPVRTRPAETAEMCTQMLFAQTAEVLDEHGSWAKIRIDVDGYEGYVDRKMISLLSDENYEAVISAPYAVVCYPVAMAVSNANQTTIILTAGSRLPNYSNGKFSLLGVEFSISPELVALNPEYSEANILRSLPYFFNIPYLWGGKNSFGMDCSGFTQVFCSLFGINLPRDASEQAKMGEVIGFLDEAVVGDLAFFENSEGNIVHVGLLIGKDSVVHCSGRVRISRIDAHGILADDQKSYTHQLRVIKRIKA